MGRIIEADRPTIVEPGLLTTRLVTGILPPTTDGHVWNMSFYEERVCPGGGVEWIVVERLAATPGNYAKMVWAALCPIRGGNDWRTIGQG